LKYEHATDWFQKKILKNQSSEMEGQCSFLDFDERFNVMTWTVNASNPFPFLAGCQAALSEDTYTMRHIPITQDASASAYQILSHFFLDPKMGHYTNLIAQPHGPEKPPVDHYIHDIYTSVLNELTIYASKQPIEDNDNEGEEAVNIIRNTFDRKIIKRIYMPLIYGKTPNSTYRDIRSKMSHKYDSKTVQRVVDICFQFWNRYYKDVNNLMELVQAVSWLTSYLDYNVIYGNNLFQTIQNYCKTTDDTLSVYFDLSRKKRTRVTIKESTPIKDPRKSMISTFANFIHQKDALIVMLRVIKCIREAEEKTRVHIPIYTIHDNFLTTIEHANKLPPFYRTAMQELGHPLVLINKFLYDNILDRADNLGINAESFKKSSDWDEFQLFRNMYSESGLLTKHKGCEFTSSYFIHKVNTRPLKPYGVRWDRRVGVGFYQMVRFPHLVQSSGSLR